MGLPAKKIDTSILRDIQRSPMEFVRRVIGVEPTDQQAKVLKAVEPPGSKVTIRSGHGTGKTTTFAWLGLWHPSMYTNSRTACTAPTSHQLKDLLWPEMHKWHERMHPLWKRDIILTADRLYIRGADKTQFAVARTARPENPDALQGFHDDNMLFLLDEAPGIHNKLFEVSEGALSTPGARAVMAGNPTKTEGYFYDSHHKNRKFWTCIHLSCIGSPLVSAEYVDSMREKYGEDSNIFRVRVLGDFPTVSDDILIPLDWVESAVGRDIHVEESEKVAGLDVARFGDDATDLLVRQGKKITYIDQWRNKDLMETCGRVVDAWKEGLFKSVAVDSIGLGSGVVDRLKELGVPCVGINVAEATAQKEKFNRLRDQLWWDCREFFHAKDCCIDPSIDLKDDLIGQLTSIKYGFTSNGKIKVEGKDEMKKRGLQSPNVADALCLTFARGVGQNNMVRALPVVNSRSGGWV